MNFIKFRRVVKNFIEKVINTGNVDIISDFISPEYTEVFNNQKYPVGIEGAIEHIIGVRKTYSDLYMSIERQIAEDEWVATCYTMSGIHTGEWMGMKPTGKRIEVTGVNINKVINGKITEHGGAANIFNSLLDINAIKIVKKKDL